MEDAKYALKMDSKLFEMPCYYIYFNGYIQCYIK